MMPKFRLKLNNIQKDLIKKHTGIVKADFVTKSTLKEIKEEVLEVINPKGAFEILDYDGKSGMVLGDKSLNITNQKLAHRLCQCHKIVIVAITLGSIDKSILTKYIENGNLLKAILLKETLLASINQLFYILEGQVKKYLDKKNEELTQRYNIGYGDGNILDANNFIDIINFKDMNLSLKDNLLYPEYTLIAIQGIYNKKALIQNKIGTIPCNKCATDDCDFREKEYTHKEDNWEQYIKNEQGFTLEDVATKKEDRNSKN